MKTARQVAEKSGQTVHVYYNKQIKQYEIKDIGRAITWIYLA